MKKTISLLSMATIMLSTQLHAAPPSSELEVSGKLTVPACTVTISDDGEYDLGNILSKTIHQTNNTTLTKVIRTWSIDCDASTYMSFSIDDKRAATASVTNNTSFGLGTINGDGKIGYYTAEMKNARVDGSTSSVYTTSNPAAFYAVTNTPLDKTQRSGWAASNNTQKSGTVFMADIEITPVLASTATMKGPVREDATIDGLLTLNFTYGM